MTSPRSPVGRILKREIREEAVTPDTWDAETVGMEYERRQLAARSVAHA